MILDKDKYRFRTTITGKIVLQIRKRKGPYSGLEIEDSTYYTNNWYDAKLKDIPLDEWRE